METSETQMVKSNLWIFPSKLSRGTVFLVCGNNNSIPPVTRNKKNLAWIAVQRSPTPSLNVGLDLWQLFRVCGTSGKAAEKSRRSPCWQQLQTTPVPTCAQAFSPWSLLSKTTFGHAQELPWYPRKPHYVTDSLKPSWCFCGLSTQTRCGWGSTL